MMKLCYGSDVVALTIYMIICCLVLFYGGWNIFCPKYQTEFCVSCLKEAQLKPLAVSKMGFAGSGRTVGQQLIEKLVSLVVQRKKKKQHNRQKTFLTDNKSQ